DRAAPRPEDWRRGHLPRPRALESQPFREGAGPAASICATLLVPIPWAGRTWALPFLTVLAPSERAASRRRRRFKPLTTWARQMIRQVHRWAPERQLIVVGDRAYAALELLEAVRAVATVIARLRLDARLFMPPPPRVPGQKGRPRLVGDRLPSLTVHA